jgi:hypothetical protein
VAHRLLDYPVATDKLRLAIRRSRFAPGGKEEHSAGEISITPVVAWLRALEQYVSFALQRSRRPIPALYLPEIPQQTSENKSAATEVT